MPQVSGESRVMLGVLKSANMNSTADQAIVIGSTKYVIRRITVQNPSTSLSLAIGGLYTGASKSGTIIVAATQVYSGLTGSTKYLDLTLASGILTDILTVGTIYLSLTTGQGGAATADIFIFGDDLS